MYSTSVQQDLARRVNFKQMPLRDTPILSFFVLLEPRSSFVARHVPRQHLVGKVRAALLLTVIVVIFARNSEILENCNWRELHDGTVSWLMP